LRGAKAAGAVAVGVVSGPCDAEELTAEGADVVLADLTEFPGWLRANAERLLSVEAGRSAPR
jgi:phosphoglycolate phosphatase